MKAIQVFKAGEPIVLSDTSIPRAGNGQVVVKQQYSSVSAMDWKVAKWNPFGAPLPSTLGYDISGIVSEVGEGITRFKVGDNVFGLADFSGGGFAQYVVAREVNLAKRVNLPPDVAGACAGIFGTVWNPLFINNDLRKRKGQTIFIAGGGGGVGHLAVQLAKWSGLKVIASAGKAGSIQLCKDCGGDHVIDYTKVDVVEEALKLTNGEGVDLAFDPTYKSSSFLQSAKVVKKGGLWIRVGGVEWNSGASDEEARKVCLEKEVEVSSGDLGRYFMPDYAPRIAEVAFMNEMCDKLYKEGVWPRISQVVPFEQEAVRQVELDMEQGKIYGKTLIEIDKPSRTACEEDCNL